MRLVKIILFLCLSAFLTYQTYTLIVKLLLSGPDELSIQETAIVAFLLTLYITGMFAFPGFVLPTSKIFPSSYFKNKNKKSLIKGYKLLGVGLYRKGLLLLFWNTRKSRVKYFNGTRTGLLNFIYQTKQAEFGHTAAFLLIILISLILLIRGYFVLTILTTLMNIIANLYPAILQRYHRIRIEKIS